MAKGEETRVRILDAAQDAILHKGFDATSIEEIVSADEITKGGFFYHFPDKNALALALIERYIAGEDQLFDELFGRAEEPNDDPLHRMLIGLQLMAELLEDLPNGHPGCMVASAAYQDRLFDRAVREKNRQAVLAWRKRFGGYFSEIAELYEPRDAVDLNVLADMISASVEGGIILSKALGEPLITAQQVRLVRSYLKLLFTPRTH
jgi:TetR/AcrR family transcriptional repressor of nem operon